MDMLLHFLESYSHVRQGGLANGVIQQVGKPVLEGIARVAVTLPGNLVVVLQPTGSCREAPVILAVNAAAMHAASHAFYQAANGGRLTDHVPPGYLSGWPG